MLHHTLLTITHLLLLLLPDSIHSESLLPRTLLNPAASAVHGSATKPHVAVIGAGFSGLTAANELKALGYKVTVFEKGGQVGGRAHRFTSSDGQHTFDAGPSWYWMPEIFDQIFQRYGRTTQEFYNLTRLDPAYRVMMPEDQHVDVPGTLPTLLSWADTLDPTNTLPDYFAQAKVKYDEGIWTWIWKP